MKLRSLVTSAALVAVALGSTLTQPAQAFTMTIAEGECTFHMTRSDDERMQKWFAVRRDLGKEIVKQLKKDIPEAATGIDSMVYHSEHVQLGNTSISAYGDIGDQVISTAANAGYNTAELLDAIENARFAIWVPNYDNSVYLTGEEGDDEFQTYFIKNAQLILSTTMSTPPENPQYSDPKLAFASELLPFYTAFNNSTYPLLQACVNGEPTEVGLYYYELEQAELKEKETPQLSSGSSFGSS